LLDDADARRIAKTFGLNVKGTIGVLLLAWRKRFLDNIKDKIMELMEKAIGYMMIYSTNCLKNYRGDNKNLYSPMSNLNCSIRIIS